MENSVHPNEVAENNAAGGATGYTPPLCGSL
jgi:hypothetical protein